MIDPSDRELKAAVDAIYGDLRGVRPNKKPRQRRKKVTQERRGKKGRTSPVIEYVRSLGKDYKTTQEVADLLGLSPNTIRKFAKDPDLKAPSYVAPFGKTVVRLYTPDDVQELQDHLAKRHRVMTREEYESDG